jgi:hypothetical protein
MKVYRELKYDCSLGFGDSVYCSMHDGIHKTDQKIMSKLEYLRREIEGERISYQEVAELQSLIDHIAPDDIQLLEWAGVPGGDK